MNHKLLRCDQDYVDLYYTIKALENRSHEAMEKIIGIEYPLSDGRYFSDIKPEDMSDDVDDLEIDHSTWRKTRPEDFPVSYPCIAVYMYDYQGDDLVEIMDFVYPSEFTS